MAITTTEGLKSRRLFRCDICRARVAIVVPRDQRNHCIDCLPERERAVFLDPAEDEEEEED